MATKNMNSDLGFMEEVALEVEQSVDINNPNTRCICMLLIDESESTKRFSTELETAFPQFTKSARESEMDEFIELGVITFNRTPHEVFPIKELYRYIEEEPAPELHLNPRGRTHTGEAVWAALNAIDRRMEKLRAELGCHIYVPVLFILTDGNPQFCDDKIGSKNGRDAWESASSELKKRVSQNQLRVVAIGVGDRINHDNLELLSGDSGEIIQLTDGTDFSALFSCVSAEMVSASQGADISSNRIVLKLLSSS